MWFKSADYLAIRKSTPNNLSMTHLLVVTINFFSFFHLLSLSGVCRDQRVDKKLKTEGSYFSSPFALFFFAFCSTFAPLTYFIF